MSFRRPDGGHGFGVVTRDGTGVIDLAARLGGRYRETGDLRLLLEAGSLDQAGDHADRAGDLPVAAPGCRLRHRLQHEHARHDGKGREMVGEILLAAREDLDRL